MKVKILLFPLSLVIALAVGVFWVKPEISSALALRTQESEAKARLDQMDQVIANIDTLDRSLEENASDRQFVETYLPKAGSDDVIVDELNFLSSESGMLLVSTDLKPVSSELAKAAAEQVQAENDKAEVAAASPGSLTGTEVSNPDLLFTNSAPDARVRATEVSVSGLGKYDQIKAFIDRVYHANHFQNFVSVDISEKPDVTQGDEKSAKLAPDVLSANIVIRFSALPETKISSGVLLDTFKKSAFDLGVVQDLRGRVANELPALDVTPANRANPFLR